MFAATFWMALREMGRNLTRSALTTLGIVIGVASVVAMVTLGRSATERVQSEIAGLGHNLLIVQPGAGHRGPVGAAATPFSLEDVRAIEKELPDVAGLAPVAIHNALTAYGSESYSTVVYGSTNAGFSVRSLKLARGRQFSEEELTGGKPACVLGERVRNELFGAQDALDEVLRVGSLSCRVVGLLTSKGKNTFGQDQDDFLMMPLAAVQRRLAGNDDVNVIFVSSSSERQLLHTKSRLEALFRERRRLKPGQKDDFTVQDTKEIANAMGSITGVLTAFLGAIAAVSLFVGGIGIVNIMLVSVTERTREIGLRLAIGALRSEVLSQFLLEAVLLCVFGGVLGAALGISASYAATRAFSLPFSIEPLVVLGAFAFSATIGIAFGYLPARRAARMNPIDALRHE